MKIKHKRGLVDVSNEDCAYRPCLQVHENRGVFVQGRGYTRLYDKPELVCFRRHLHGCPHPQPAPDPALIQCCDEMEFAPPRKNAQFLPWRQKCRGCGVWSSGAVLHRRRKVLSSAG